ncbi:hypothetical protein [Holospora curviuscula]|uniref:Glycosyl transferase CAP10 domain-containing protein n=1 Tax=Holospora curviuscula TaxID=1082868 RepID=A0A2S5R723_9PROT|nr:hypothetical protein [Holospora curviuscula]PPE03136.1 hypothetical protein HCUR_01412 [Holospora curviuscula]
MKAAIFYIGEKIANTVYDHLMSFQVYGQYTYHYVDIVNSQITSKNIEAFDVLIIHYTLSLFNDERCPAWLRLIFRNTKAKKVVFIQDEYRRVNDVVENLNFIKADVLYTCVPESEIEKVYPTEKIPGLIKRNTLTGFVPEILLSRYRPSYEERQLDVVYRARKLSAWYGRLGQEKWIIAEKFKHDVKRYNLTIDIAYQEQDRIYGDQWIDFLTKSKAAIGCESGASVFDFTGTIQDQVEAYEKTHPNATFEEIEEKFFKGLDGQINLNQISPRCFECAVLGTLMVLYEGNYSNILKPWRHYIPLKKDHSNMEEIVRAISSPEEWRRITQYAFEEIAMNQKYHYKGFIEIFERDLEHFFKIFPSTQKQGMMVSVELKSKFTSEKQPIYPLITGILKNFLNKAFGEKIVNILVLYKCRIALSLGTLRNLISDHGSPWIFYLYSFRKDFCEEYIFVQEVNQYISAVQEKCDYLPFEINNTNFSVYIMISPNHNSPRIVDSIKNKKKKVVIEIDNNFGVPKKIRGLKVSLQYNQAIKVT